MAFNKFEARNVVHLSHGWPTLSLHREVALTILIGYPAVSIGSRSCFESVDRTRDGHDATDAIAQRRLYRKIEAGEDGPAQGAKRITFAAARGSKYRVGLCRCLTLRLDHAVVQPRRGSFPRCTATSVAGPLGRRVLLNSDCTLPWFAPFALHHAARHQGLRSRLRCVVSDRPSIRRSNPNAPDVQHELPRGAGLRRRRPCRDKCKPIPIACGGRPHSGTWQNQEFARASCRSCFPTAVLRRAPCLQLTMPHAGVQDGLCQSECLSSADCSGGSVRHTRCQFAVPGDGRGRGPACSYSSDCQRRSSAEA